MSTTGCIDEEIALALAEGSIPDERRVSIERHLDGCETCFELVLDAARALDAEETVLEAGLRELRSGASSLEPGELVDHFRVERLLGRGGMGEVYLAQDTELGRPVALKVMSRAMLAAPEALDRFTTEARATAKLSHPNIVTIHAIGRHRGAPYVALEYVQGRTLREVLADGPLEAERAREIALAIAEAIRAAHARGVWHRDLKPANVVVGTDERVRVLDFGLAKITDPEAAPPPSAAELTTAGGTPMYMAPEQWRRERATGPADVWALGVMMCELFAGEHPFVDRSERRASSFDVLAERVGSGAARAAAIAAVPAPFGELVSRCLRRDPGERPTADELRDALAEPASRTRGRPWLRGLVVASVAAAGVALVVRLAAQPSPSVSVQPADATPTASVTASATATAIDSAPAQAVPAPSASTADDRPLPAGSARAPKAAPSSTSTTTSAASAATGSPVANRCAQKCKSAGRCVPDPKDDNHCLVGSDADCRQSDACKNIGQCVFDGWMCQAASISGCRDAAVCRNEGRCSSDGWSCVATADGCRSAARCGTEGRCTMSGKACIAATDAECASSARCKSEGRCKTNGEICVAPLVRP